MNNTTSNEVTTPHSLPATVEKIDEGDVTGGVIPYKNPHALTAYYLGLFSIIPVIGFVLACFAVPLGISGLKQRKKRPAIRGSVHAWIGIIIGGLSLLVHLSIVAAIAIGFAQQR